MDSRIALNNGTVLRFDKGAVEYTIQNELARGGSSIVYNASYTDNTGDEKFVRIKECYPFKLDISRDDIGNLVPVESNVTEFKQVKDKMREAYKRGNEFFRTDGLTNFTANTYNLHENNNTIYIVSAYSQGEVLSCDVVTSLKDAISIVRSVASAIQKIHNKGYLYLDIKPDNIFTFNGTREIIQLFDFDSLIPISITERNESDYDCKISYTKGFAALEQKTGNFKKIGKYSDVYGIGALLFYLVLNRVPNALDCDYDAVYEFASSKFAVKTYQDKLFFRLEEFFHKTLAHYYLDRYQDMEIVLEKLDELIRLSDTDIPYINSTKISNPKFMIGRTEESDYLSKWFLQNESNCLFVTGMGGIGKSTLVRSFLAQNIEKFDAVIYVNYNVSIVRTIIDDSQIIINTIQKDESENFNEYFIRKLNAIRKLAVEKEIVLIIDNYTGEPDQNLTAILGIDWKVVLIARNKSFAEGYDVLEVNAIQKNETLYLLFENHLGKALNENDYLYINNIIEKVAAHTLVLELIAKQITKSYITIAEASSLVDEQGFSNIASEKVDYTKDFTTYHETVRRIINSLFDATQLSETKKTILKIISLFGINGIDIKVFSVMLELSSKDDINELISESWISIDDMHISMHPVIMETIRQWELTENSKTAVIQVMNFLYKQLKLEAQREEYPLKLLKEFPRMERIQKLSEICNSIKGLHFLTKKCECLQKVIDFPVNDITQEIVYERMLRGCAEITTDHKKVTYYLQLSELFLEECKKEKNICELEVYKKLMYQEILNMPREREEYILSKSKELKNDSYFQNRNQINNLLDLYDRIVSIYVGKKDFQIAYDKIMEVKTVVKKYQDKFIIGRWYYLLAGYYNVRLDEHYNPETEEDKKFCRDLIHNLNKAIQCMKKSREGMSNRYLGEYYCFKALVLIRGISGNPSGIAKLLNKAEIFIKENEQVQSRRVRDYNMTCAWYYTYIEHDFKKVVDYISEACRITSNISQTDIDKIDEIKSIIKIFSEWRKDAVVIKWIESAIIICKRHKNVLVYLRKEIELLKYWLDISYKKQDFEICKVIIKGIEEDAEMVGLNMEQIISVDLRNEICSK